MTCSSARRIISILRKMPSCRSRGISGSIFPPFVLLLARAEARPRTAIGNVRFCLHRVTGISSGDIAFQLLDHELLVGDDGFDQVAYGNQADELPRFDD